MIVQVNKLREDSVQFTGDYIKSSKLKLTIAEIDKNQLKILSSICNNRKINLEKVNGDTPSRNYLTVSSTDIINLLQDFEEKNELEIQRRIERAIESFKNYNRISVRIKGIEIKQPAIMGILNVTPDSFSDGGLYFDKKSAVEHALIMFESGADIVDIGGESTRPGADPVSEKEESGRVIPVIEEIIKRKEDAVISVDTTKSNVARMACKAGARIINDISGLTFDPEIAEVAAEYSTALVIMHIKGKPKDMQTNPVYYDLIYEIFEYLNKQAEIAKLSGVENIIIDPGIGFGKKIEDNFEILRRLSDFKCLGYPILIGLSRKSFLGKTLNLDLNERDTVTSVAEALAIRNGAKIIRTHNVVNAVKTRNLLNYFYQN